MKRREFVLSTLPAALLPAVVNGHSVRTLGQSALLDSMFNFANETDRVLVIIQLNGGNDGLNTVIPRDTYAAYSNARKNVAIPENKILTLSGNAKTGLHPSMKGMQALYNEGKLSIIQSVGYPDPNFSHFRASDIWMSGSDSNQNINSGWVGRYLKEQYANYPTGYPNAAMPDPPAIQIGSVTSLTLQGPAASMGMSITSATQFYSLINGIQEPVAPTPSGKELAYIRLVAQQTQQYATVIKKAAGLVAQQVAYPANNKLAEQLKIVARLVKGGLKTRIYMVSLGGFDTHSVQVNTTDPLTGNHANLLTTVSDAVKAFMDDLKFLGIQERVIGMTFSEFGRRIKSNSSLGTDHGAAAPMFLFGSQVQSGVLGNNPSIPANVSVNDNIPHQYDYRSVYASILQNWFCASTTTLQSVLLKNFQSLPILKSSACATGIDDLNRDSDDTLIINYPNPFTEKTNITFKTKGGHTLVQVMDTLGRVISNLVDKDFAPGTFNVDFSSGELPTGVYYMRFQNGTIQQVRPMLKTR
jgi:uncharacterized protein (DUF1501 family)